MVANQVENDARMSERRTNEEEKKKKRDLVDRWDQWKIESGLGVYYTTEREREGQRGDDCTRKRGETIRIHQRGRGG